PAGARQPARAPAARLRRARVARDGARRRAVSGDGEVAARKMNASRHVLIVDDEPPARERLERLVGELDGWRVAGTCGSGAEALEQAARLKPDVVLLDIRMPGMSGIETAQHPSGLEAPPAVHTTTAS